MSEINRSLITLKPKQPLLDWVRNLDNESEELTLAELAKDSTVYLVPEIWQDSDQQEALEECYEILFEDQLEAWWTDPTAWPSERNLKLFLDWFEVEFHRLVVDLCDGPICIVEDEDDEDDLKTQMEH